MGSTEGKTFLDGTQNSFSGTYIRTRARLGIKFRSNKKKWNGIILPRSIWVHFAQKWLHKDDFSRANLTHYPSTKYATKRELITLQVLKASLAHEMGSKHEEIERPGTKWRYIIRFSNEREIIICKLLMESPKMLSSLFSKKTYRNYLWNFSYEILISFFSFKFSTKRLDTIATYRAIQSCRSLNIVKDPNNYLHWRRTSRLVPRPPMRYWQRAVSQVGSKFYLGDFKLGHGSTLTDQTCNLLKARYYLKWPHTIFKWPFTFQKFNITLICLLWNLYDRNLNKHRYKL
jgi:hypothetical protein